MHPQARRVISHRLDDFLEGNQNQVILTTHSHEFITTAHENLNIILVRKDSTNGTEASNANFVESKEKQILVKTQNSEMFFADRVILVEGGDKYIIESVAKYYGSNIKPELGTNWLNEKNYSIIAVGGKTEFWKYYKKLRELKIPVFIIADFDFLLRRLSEFLTNVKVNKIHVDELNTLKSKMGFQDIQLRKRILQEIHKFREFIIGEGYELDEREIKNKLKEPFKVKKISQIKSECHSDILSYLEKLKTKGIFILENELEDYYKENCKNLTNSISGKEEKPIYITSQLVNETQDITNFIECKEYIDFFNKFTT